MGMDISGKTTVFAVLGHPVQHTLSPVMHNAALRAMGRDALYAAFDVTPERCLPVLEAMRDMGFGGVNLTVPLKETAWRGLTELDPTAELLGAVNTVAFEQRGLVGHNTDGYGFLRAVEEAFGEGVAGRRLFLLGAGGAGRAVALTAARAGAASVALADLDAGRVRRVAEEMQVAAPGMPAEAVVRDAWLERARMADLVVQATPVGMKRDHPSPLPPEAFHEGQRLFDLVYMYPETAIMKAARSKGAEAANGLGMLLYQGARSFTIWTGVEPPVEVMRNALEQAVYR